MRDIRLRRLHGAKLVWAMAAITLHSCLIVKILVNLGKVTPSLFLLEAHTEIVQAMHHFGDSGVGAACPIADFNKYSFHLSRL